MFRSKEYLLENSPKYQNVFLVIQTKRAFACINQQTLKDKRAGFLKVEFLLSKQRNRKIRDI